MRKEAEAVLARRSRSREALRAAATGLLDERDTSKISITDVVNEAGVTRPTFYHAFGSVSQLFASAALGRLEEAFARIEQGAARPVGDVREEMGAAFEVVLAALAEHEVFFRRVLDGPAAYAVVTALTDAVSSRLESASPAVALLRGDGLARAAELRGALAAGTVWMVVDWLNADEGSRPPIAVAADRARDFVYHSVVGGLSAMPSPQPDHARSEKEV